jgi:hypothetical protein
MAFEMGCQRGALQLFAGWRETEYMTIAISVLHSQYGRFLRQTKGVPRFPRTMQHLVWKLTLMHSFLGGEMSSMTYNG